jgi:N utilization substance protein A
MNIDMAALKGLVREKDVSLDTVVEALESALLAAYERTEGAQPRARVALDRKSGEVTVWAQEVDDEGQVVREYDDTPGDFGRIAAMTAKHVIMSRLRDHAQETTCAGESAFPT